MSWRRNAGIVPALMEVSVMVKRALAVCAVVLGLSVGGCVTAPSQEVLATLDYGPAPQDPDSIVKAYLQPLLKDPESLRLRREGAPYEFWHRVFGGKLEHGWRVCYYVNARNSYGGYTGELLYFFLIRNDVIVDTLDQGTGDNVFTNAQVRQACSAT